MQPNLGQMAADSYKSNMAAQANDNRQLAQSQADYANAKNVSNQAQSSLSDFSKNMQSGTSFYNTGVQQGNVNSGYDVNNLNQAQNQVSNLTGIIGGLPRAVQAQNANYGATAGNVANEVSTEGANLNQSLGLANQNAANQIAKQNAGLTYGQGYATAGLQGQQNQLTGLTASATNATNQLQQYSQVMNNWAQIAQQQGGLTASQQASYASAKQAYASAAQAMAQVGLIQSHTIGSNLNNAAAEAKTAQATQNATDNPRNLPVIGRNPDGSPILGPSAAQQAASKASQDNFNANNGVFSVNNLSNFWNSAPLY